MEPGRLRDPSPPPPARVSVYLSWSCWCRCGLELRSSDESRLPFLAMLAQMWFRALLLFGRFSGLSTPDLISIGCETTYDAARQTRTVISSHHHMDQRRLRPDWKGDYVVTVLGDSAEDGSSDGETTDPGDIPRGAMCFLPCSRGPQARPLTKQHQRSALTVSLPFANHGRGFPVHAIIAARGAPAPQQLVLSSGGS